MILKIDSDNKQIILESPVNLKEFNDTIWEWIGEEEETEWTIVPEMKFTFVN